MHHRTNKILIAEDHESILNLVSVVFSDSRYELLCAQDGETALNMVRKYMPDIVLLDINLPKSNGFNVCRAIKSSPELKHIKVIMLSGQTQQDDFAAALEMGAEGYIVKPFKPAELVKKVEELL